MENLEVLKKHRLNLVFLLLLLSLVLVFNQQFYGIFGQKNYVAIHLMMEILIIIASFSIAIQAWLIVPYILSNRRMYIGALFLSLGLTEIIHTLSYKGMPFFIEESSPYSATWFYIIGRLTLPVGLLIIYILKPKKVSPAKRWSTYGFATLYVAIWILLIFQPTHLLPSLFIDGVGTTVLKKSLQFIAVLLQIILIVYLRINRNSSPIEKTMIIIGSIFLILGDIMFTTYVNVYDIRNFIGHVLQLLSYHYFLKALYYSSVEEPFKLLVETKAKLENSKESLHHTAYHDELTGLPNLRFLNELLTSEIEKKDTKTAILMLKINRLKAIYDSIGTTFTDKVIQEVAIRLRESLPREIFISRLNGGEFTIILHEVKEQEEIVRVCNKIHQMMKMQFQIQHFQLKVTLNIGISIFPDHGNSIEELLKHAQVAMRKAQQEVERYLFYQPKMEQHLEERIMLEHDLHNALKNGELFLEYQPQFNVSTGKIDAVEALVRWQHPKKGVISPATFIPMAEETGLIVPIGEWVLETACRQTKEWHDQGMPNLCVAVNLSIRQFFQHNLVNTIKDILRKTNLSPDYLELEITESMTMDTKHTIETLESLKGVGVKIAIDDFGTGYSSLSYLKDFPIDCLKIDRAFVQNIQSNDQEAVLISMIISLAKHLNLKIIAEGVEKIDQFAFLAQLNVDYIQGYLCGKPMHPEELSVKFEELQKRVYNYI
ncbi:bifunctional diguanylate cyclase/phosphodiesterase [Rummeliibacillus pycnus]|uniref:bifunctional diguanylate cyclase/phosphodiesterase n=1 Tax=Rummeliibacillus pycnus TaxID=101070 RepID=UPI000C999F80|nr:EAL domain-containing protein [Rummeliibacillus pycnus]